MVVRDVVSDTRKLFSFDRAYMCEERDNQESLIFQVIIQRQQFEEITMEGRSLDGPSKLSRCLKLGATAMHKKLVSQSLIWRKKTKKNAREKINCEN